MEINSYSPSINKKLQVKSLRSLTKKNIYPCNNLLKINIGTKKKPNCQNFNNSKVKKLMLKNLKASKHLKPELFIAPKQLIANCWFNTMFVTFFFSDKGRKFFRFFRELMIKGVKVDGTKIEDKKLRELFFIFNLFIEASYNQGQNIKNKTKNNKLKKKIKNNKTKNKKAQNKGLLKKDNLYEKIKILTNNLQTNYLIKVIYERINNKIYNSIPDVNDAGNPVNYYKALINYLNYDVLKILEMDIENNVNINYFINNKFEYINTIPDIIIINDMESKSHYDNEYYFKNILSNKSYLYKLDSIILTNKGFFKPKTNKHFVSVCTINKKGYKFDGDSYSRLSRFEWKDLINVNKDWDFVENKNYISEKYNFTKGYKILFYYRENY